MKQFNSITTHQSTNPVNCRYRRPDVTSAEVRETYRSFWPITLLFQFRFPGLPGDSNSGFRVIHPSGRVNPFQLSNHCFSLLSGSLQTAFFIDLTSCFCLRRGSAYVNRSLFNTDYLGKNLKEYIIFMLGLYSTQRTTFA